MVESRTVSNAVIIDLPGMFESDKLQDEVQKHFQSQNLRIAVNLSNITFIESCGLGALVSVFKFCDNNGGAVVFYGVQPYVDQLLQLTKLNRILKICRDEAEALEALSN